MVQEPSVENVVEGGSVEAGGQGGNSGIANADEMSEEEWDADYADFLFTEKQLTASHLKYGNFGIPASIACDVLKKDSTKCQLTDEDGNRWGATLRWSGRSRNECVLGSGWLEYARAKNFKEVIVIVEEMASRRVIQIDQKYRNFMVEYDPLSESGTMPMLFNRKFYDKIANRVWLNDPHNNQIEVRVQKILGRVFLKDGWTKIRDIYQLNDGGVLRLYFDSPNEFTMYVHNRCMDAIDYPEPPKRYSLAGPPSQLHIHHDNNVRIDIGAEINDIDEKFRVFLLEFDPQSANIVWLRDPYKNRIEVKVDEVGGQVYLSDGWYRLRKIYKLDEGGWIQLHMQSRNEFLMFVRDRDMQAIDYPKKGKQYLLGQPFSPIIIEDDNVTDSDVGEESGHNLGGSDVGEESGEVIQNQDDELELDDSTQAYVSVQKTLTGNHVTNSIFCLPSILCSKGLIRGTTECEIVDQVGNVWDCNLRWVKRYRNECYLSKNWLAFVDANNLNEGSVIRFVVCKAEPSKIKIEVVV